MKPPPRSVFRITGVVDEEQFQSNFLNDLVNRLSATRAANLERLARQVARTYLPRRLGWLVDHPRLLRIAYKLRPSWCPMIYYGIDGDATAVGMRSKDGTFHLLETSMGLSQ